MNAVVVQCAPAKTVVVHQPEPQVVVQRSTNVVIDRAPPQVDVSPACCEGRTTEVVTAGPQGPQGVPGDGTFTLTAGAGGISALRVVVAEAGVARYPNINDPEDAGRVVGVSFTAATAGNIFVVQSDGPINEPLWTWSPGPVWCGTDGVLTQIQPAAPAWLMEVGRARQATGLLLDIQKPIIRS